MEICNISKGQIFKNYKALCSELKIKEKTSGKSRQLQMKNLKRYFTYYRDGQKIVITEIYNNPKPKIDNRGKDKGSRGNNKVYNDWIQWLLLDLLAQKQNNGKICISRSDLMRRIDMTNENYGYLMDSKPKIAKKIKADEMIVQDFYRSNNTHFKRTIESTLKDLRDKRIIEYKTVKMLKRKFINKHELADDNDIDNILKTEKDILEQLGFNKESEMIKEGKYLEYWKRVNETIQRNTDIDYYYSAYEININQHYIKKELNSLVDLLLKDIKRNEFRDALNKRVTEHLLDNAKGRYKKETEKEKLNPFDVEYYRCNDDYIIKIKDLIKLLIDKHTPNQVDEIKKIKSENKKVNIEDNFFLNMDEKFFAK